MKWKLWVRNLSVSGPRVAVRTQLPWPLRAAIALMAVAVAVLAGLAGYQYGRGRGGPGLDQLETELSQVRSQLADAAADRDRQATAAVNWESQLKVERSTQEQVRLQLKTLENENARLKSDLAFFESLLPTPANATAKGVVIRSFRVQADAEPNSLRYRLLVQQSGRPDRDFVGAVILTVNLQQGGRPWVLQLPDPALPHAGPAPLSFRHYQRVEGSFAVPAGATVRSVLVRIESGGETRAQQTFTL